MASCAVLNTIVVAIFGSIDLMSSRDPSWEPVHVRNPKERRRGPRPQHILVVDDSDTVRRLWCQWLTVWGFSVEEAVDGAEAVTRAEARRPDVVLMDMWMPVLDGFAATMRLRGIASTADVPVVCMSGDAVSPTPERALAAGCSLFLSKPFPPAVLLEHLRAAFRAVDLARSSGGS